MKNGLVLGLAILGGLYFLSYFGFRSGPMGWGWRSSYFNNFGIWPGHSLFWVAALIILGIAVVGFFSKSAGKPISSKGNDRNSCPHCGGSLDPLGKDSERFSNPISK
ncbi:MAG: hypothetical protein HY879_18760 [Deltaproteobacteria bacterium]|nr:hypothetical protein [Deltaproteobacteria bacterium]